MLDERVTTKQWCKRNIFQRGQSHFFFSWNAMLFPGTNFHFGRFGRPPKKSVVSKSEKQKKKKKKKVLRLIPYFPLLFQIFHLSFHSFPSFLLHFIFPFFLTSLFLVDQQKFVGEKRGGSVTPLQLKYISIHCPKFVLKYF